MERLCIKALYEVSGEVKSAAIRNTTVGKVNGGNLKNSWQSIIDEENMIAQVGSPLENAIWEEFGTGELAEHGKGRKGGWWIPVGEGPGQISRKVVNAYGLNVRTGKNGMEFVHSYGKPPKRILTRAFIKNKNAIKKCMEYHLSKLGDK